MSWDDDSYADEYDEYGERRRARAPVTAPQVVGRVAGYAALVAGVVALSVGAVVALGVVGLANKPGGFAAPSANGQRLALPPVIAPLEQDGQDGQDEQGEQGQPGEQGEQGEQVTQLDGQSEVIEDPTGMPDSEAAPMPPIDPEWTVRIAAATGIPERPLAAYALAHVAIAEAEPECGLDWATIAAIGGIESGHGSHGGAVLDEYGNAHPAIIGRALDGDGVATIEDTDGGLLDGDVTWDRAVGPMQFIPSTWARWASDGNGDGVADPHQIDDAAQAAARYLCASGPMTSPEGWRAAVFSYNHDNDYVDKVARAANEYAASAR